METIVQQIKRIQFPFEIKDENGNVVYREYSDKSWSKYGYDFRGNETYYENSEGIIIDRQRNCNLLQCTFVYISRN